MPIGFGLMNRVPEASSFSFYNRFSCPATPASNQPRRHIRTLIVSCSWLLSEKGVLHITTWKLING
jgi:hypothetical protein